MVTSHLLSSPKDNSPKDHQKNGKPLNDFMISFVFFQCSNGGCLIELAQQLAVIMVGKQIINNAQEIVIPKLKAWWHNKRVSRALSFDFMSSFNVAIKRFGVPSKRFSDFHA